MKKKILLALLLMLAIPLSIYAVIAIEHPAEHPIEHPIENPIENPTEKPINETDGMFVYYFGYERMANTDRANFYGDSILSTFSADRMGRFIYPDFFGGDLINDDGHLVVNIVTSVMSLNEADDMMQDMFGEEHGVILQPADFSLNELNEVLGVINRALHSGRDEIQYVMEVFRGCGVWNSINRLKVKLYPLNDETIALFRDIVVDSHMLIFEEGHNGNLSRERDFTTLPH
ncbi:MAG: hypothetical protein FWF81_13265 [Defluviitaleaceae bacterium]|nr:hypothetical protein [Defluviitaleaceae bacterium]